MHSVKVSLHAVYAYAHVFVALFAYYQFQDAYSCADALLPSRDVNIMTDIMGATCVVSVMCILSMFITLYACEGRRADMRDASVRSKLVLTIGQYCMPVACHTVIFAMFAGNKVFVDSGLLAVQDKCMDTTYVNFTFGVFVAASLVLVCAVTHRVAVDVRETREYEKTFEV